MVLYGAWLTYPDGNARPVLYVWLTAANGRRLKVELVVDTGADRTVLTADVLAATGLTPLPAGERLEGAGGTVRGVLLNTLMEFTTADDRQVRMNGPFLALTDPTALDLNVLGRDVLSNFDVIVSRRKKIVALLADPHTFKIDPHV